MPKIFLSFHFDNKRPEQERFIHRVSFYLKKQPGVVTYCYLGDESNRKWKAEVGKAIKDCDKLALFMGDTFGKMQTFEADDFVARHPEDLHKHAVVVKLSDSDVLPDKLFQYRPRVLTVNQVRMSGGIDDEQAQWCAEAIAKAILKEHYWITDDGLPIGYPFEYEKGIIDEFIAGNGKLFTARRIEEGCPELWPEVVRRKPYHPNPIKDEAIGKPRPDDANIIVDARSIYHHDDRAKTCLKDIRLTFPEAGPRETLRYPVPEHGGRLGVGILVSGGIAPGINAVISGIIERHHLYWDRVRNNPRRRYKLSILGFKGGFRGLRELRQDNEIPLDLRNVERIASESGSIIGTSRLEELLPSTDAGAQKERLNLLRNMVRALEFRGIDILYIIGGDGSMRAAHAIGKIASELKSKKQLTKDISVVAVPKTMDNDILWVWQSFGFLSAVEKAKEFVRQLFTEVNSNPRLCVMQLFGSDSGFVVSHAALAGGGCDLVLIPEIEFNMKETSRYVTNKLRGKGPGSGCVILMAETAIPQDVDTLIEDSEIGLDDNEKKEIREFLLNNRRVHGQTPQDLRAAGLKIVSRVLQREIRKMKGPWKDYRVFTNEPRHLIRAIAPSVQDVIFGKRLGTLAVDNAMAGYADFMISQWMTEFVLIPLSLVVLGRKRVPRDGIFWKSVVATTGQTVVA
jgi:6-phosphofructokinase 1